MDAANSCKGLAFLKVTMPDREMVRPRSSTFRPNASDAVKQWISAGKCALPQLVRQDVYRIVFGVAGVDDYGQAGFARHADMHPEQCLLHGAVRFVVVIIQPGFADCDDARVGAGGQQSPAPEIGMRVCLVRMDTYAGPDVGLAMCGGDDLIPFATAWSRC